VGGAPSGRAWQAVMAGVVGVTATVLGVAVFLPRVVLGEASAGNVAARSYPSPGSRCSSSWCGSDSAAAVRW
jgi:hypothetical protein